MISFVSHIMSYVKTNLFHRDLIFHIINARFFPKSFTCHKKKDMGSCYRKRNKNKKIK